ncbi:MAG TPA: sigma-70 family RNA polymerase sigma factor [Gemmataceae bacterium]|jgi:RNA polymerase sigma-70 factor (ECF subfamily)|nr:sigma-70 family RNA polymerase sigma factor [Gemmataceae bacterium]
MGDALLTRSSLLARLGDPQDRTAWEQFVKLYGGLVYGFVRERGLQDADAADLTQEVFLVVARAMDHWRYNPEQGSFRGWLYGVTRNKLARFLQRRRFQAIGAGSSNGHRRLDEVRNRDPDPKDVWEQEFQQHLFRVAAMQVKENFAAKTWQAFMRTAVEGLSAAVVARELGLSVGSVYVAKSRVLMRLSEEIKRLQSE